MTYLERILNKVWTKEDDLIRFLGGVPTWFTSGCFDLFHYGHLKLLAMVAEDAHNDNCNLIVAVNSDESIKLLKGEYPILPLLHRQLMVAGCTFVDHVISFSGAHPLLLIDKLQPEVLAHGSGKTSLVTEAEVFPRIKRKYYHSEMDNLHSSSIRRESILRAAEASAEPLFVKFSALEHTRYA